MSRNDSAMRVAVNAARRRTSAGSSEVATTTTARARPSGPRSFSMNSRTSRPRSPTRASTVTDASVPRVIIDNRVDLPTPEPAKMPMRCPRPQGTSVSSARTPSGSDSSIMRRVSGCGAAWSTPTCGTLCSGGPPSIGRPSPSSTRPRSAGPIGTEVAPSAPSARSPARTPRSSPSGMQTRPSWRTATTSAMTPSCWPSTSLAMRTDAPIGSCNPSISRFSPTTRATRPCARGLAARSTDSSSALTRAPHGRGRARRRRERRYGTRRHRRCSRRASGSDRARSRGPARARAPRGRP